MDEFGEEIEEFFPELSLAAVQRHVSRLGESDLERQIWFIRASICTQSKGAYRARPPARRAAVPDATINRKRLVGAAQSIGNRLATLALRGEDDATWVGLTLTAKDRWALVPSDPYLYDGLAGIVLFLAYLGFVTGDDRHTALAEAALKTVQRHTEAGRSPVARIGAFDGWSGLVYTLTHVSRLWRKPHLLSNAENLIALFSDAIDSDHQFDVISGSAGCIGSLISLLTVKPSEGTLACAVQCGRRLVAQARPMTEGIGWSRPDLEGTPLTGFSHGAAGIAWALFELAAVTGDAAFRTAALAAIAYERSVFSSRESNWPDLRKIDNLGEAHNDNRERFSTAWCHGAPGIGLSRLMILKHFDDPSVRSEIAAALDNTMAYGFGYNHSLCHGDLGNLDFISQASRVVENARPLTEYVRAKTIALESLDLDDWICGNPLGIEAPGLMTGLAGIGYGLLRLADPDRIPSVLALAPP